MTLSAYCEGNNSFVFSHARHFAGKVSKDSHFTNIVDTIARLQEEITENREKISSLIRMASQAGVQIEVDFIPKVKTLTDYYPMFKTIDTYRVKYHIADFINYVKMVDAQGAL
jgi:hypothetical protein